MFREIRENGRGRFVRGTWGAVTRRAHQRGLSRTPVYTHAQHVVPAVARAQAGGSSAAALGHENERLKAEHAALGPAWADAAALREATQRARAGSGCAMGLRRSQSVTLCAMGWPLGAVPRRARRGRWVQAAAAHAGRRLVGLALAWQARGRVRCLDDIFLQRAPGLMAIAPHRMAWMAGPRGPDRRGESGREVRPHWPCLEHVSADGGPGLARGVKRAPRARGAQGEAAETGSRQAMTRGLDVGHTPRARARARQRQGPHAERQLAMARQAEATGARSKRQGRAQRGGSGVAGGAWRQAERRCDPAENAPAAVHPIPAALAWCEAKGRLEGRQTAQAQRDAACPQLPGACGSHVQRLLREERPLRHWDRLRAPLTAAVAEPGWREAFTRWWDMNDQRRQTQGDARRR